VWVTTVITMIRNMIRNTTDMIYCFPKQRTWCNSNVLYDI